MKGWLAKYPVERFYGGHQILSPGVVEEGIELCACVIAGTDEREKTESFFGVGYYGAKRKKEGSGREDGKEFNLCYSLGNITGRIDRKQVIGKESKAGLP